MPSQQYLSLRSEVLANTLACGGIGSPANPVIGNEKHIDKLLACVLQSVEDNGLQWSLDNPEKIAELSFEQLNVWVRIGLFILGFLTGGATWVTILEWIVPVILRILSERFDPATCSVSDFSGLVDDALTYHKENA